MQVFLPEQSYKACAKVLDQKRLVKQLLEGRQILSALAGETKGWVNHPATRMFAGAEDELVRYLYAIKNEMEQRKYKWENNWAIIIDTFNRNFRNDEFKDPDYLKTGHPENHRLITTHRGRLYEKAPELYPQYEWESKTYRDLVCCDKCNYYWPTHPKKEKNCLITSESLPPLFLAKSA
jgi:hypothetical protein